MRSQSDPEPVKSLVKSPLKAQQNKPQPQRKNGNELTDNSRVSANTTNVAKANEKAMLEILANNKGWTYALVEMRNQFRNCGLESSLLRTYTLNHYYKKVTTIYY